MNEIVIHHNDLNELVFPDFKEQEFNVFSNIITRLRDRGAETLEFSASEVSSFFGSAYNFETLAFMLTNMADSMRKKGFVHISQVGEIRSKAYITMFPTFVIKTKPNPNFKNDPILSETLLNLKVRVNKDFLYLFNNLVKNFTQYELDEFVSINGKYTKRLYMLLKQYRNTGQVTIYKDRWDDFCKLLNIPKNYRQIDIDQRILKPAIKELSQPTLFDNNRLIFKNLAYEKIKGGKGGKVIGIIFTFKPENIEVQKIKKENEKVLNDENIDLDKALDNLIGQRWQYEKKYPGKILKVNFIDNIEVNCEVLERDKNENLISCGTATIVFNSQEQLVKNISQNLC